MLTGALIRCVATYLGSMAGFGTYRVDHGLTVCSLDAACVCSFGAHRVEPSIRAGRAGKFNLMILRVLFAVDGHLSAVRYCTVNGTVAYRAALAAVSVVLMR